MHRCTKCGSKGLVAQTRETTYHLIRRRVVCKNAACGERWTTFEMHEKDYQPLMRARHQFADVCKIVGKPLQDGIETRLFLGQEWVVGSDAKR